MTEILTESANVLTFTEYDSLIGDLMEKAKMYIKDGDLSNGTVLLDWKSGSNVSISLNVTPQWEERKIAINSAELNIVGLDDSKDSKVVKLIKSFLGDYKIPLSIKESKEDNSELEYLKEIAGI